MIEVKKWEKLPYKKWRRNWKIGWNILVGVKREGWFILSGLKRRMGYPGRIEEKNRVSW